MRKTTLQFQGIPVHICYDILPQNVVTWNLDGGEYKEVNGDLLKLVEALLRQVHGNEIQIAVIEHDFYLSLQNEPWPDTDYDPDKTPF